MLSEVLRLPSSLLSSHKLTKKSFYEHGQLSASAQRLLQDQVESVYIKAHITPDNSNISAYKNEQQEYLELFVIELDLKDDQAWLNLKPSQIKTLHEIIQKSIAYPLLLEIRSGEHVQWSLAEKNLHQGDADYDKLIVNELIQTDWLDTQSQSELEQSFMQNLVFEKLNRQNLFQLYQSLMLKFTTYLLATQTKQSGRVFLEQDSEAITQQTLDQQRQRLKQIKQLQKEIGELQNKLQACHQFNQKVDLNMQLQAYNTQLNVLKAGH